MNLVISTSEIRTPRLPIRTALIWPERKSSYSLLLEMARREQTSLMVSSFIFSFGLDPQMQIVVRQLIIERILVQQCHEHQDNFRTDRD